MKRSLLGWLKRLFFKIISPAEIAAAIDSYKVVQSEKQVVLGKGSKLYPESLVSNLQNNPSKIAIGTNTHIRGELLLFASSGQITIGDNSYIGLGSIIRSQEKIVIGNNVLIAHNCTIIDTDSHEMNHLKRANDFVDMVANGHSLSKGTIKTAPIYIEDYAWLSYNVSILKGVTIGEGAIVAAGSVVTKDVAPFCIVAGNPATVIKQMSRDN